MRFSRLSIDYAIAFAFLCSMSFLLPRLLPGDPFLAIYGEEASLNITPEIKAEIMRRFALDQPLYKQFFAFILSLLRLDFRQSRQPETVRTKWLIVAVTGLSVMLLLSRA